MSGVVKSGLIFAAVGLVGVFALSFVPFVGALCCGPLAAAGVGMAAGYYGARWSDAERGIGRGVLAGAMAGLGALIGAAIYYLIIFRIVQDNPEIYLEVMRGFLGEGGVQMSPEELSAMARITGPIMALCFGVLNLLIALALGALGGWLATRNRPHPTPPMQPPPLTPAD